jgi:hypothetical protein
LTVAFSVVALFGVCLGTAEAGTQNACLVQTVLFDSSQRLALWCNGVATIFYSFGPNYGTACRPVSFDTTKVWESMLQAALLSGKKVDVLWDKNAGCYRGTVSFITGIKLQAN